MRHERALGESERLSDRPAPKSLSHGAGTSNSMAGASLFGRHGQALTSQQIPAKGHTSTLGWPTHAAKRVSVGLGRVCPIERQCRIGRCHCVHAQSDRDGPPSVSLTHHPAEYRTNSYFPCFRGLLASPYACARSDRPPTWITRPHGMHRTHSQIGSMKIGQPCEIPTQRQPAANPPSPVGCTGLPLMSRACSIYERLGQCCHSLTRSH